MDRRTGTERERENERERNKKREGAMRGCRGNASLLSFHHRALIVSNPLTHTVVSDKHVHARARTHTHTHCTYGYNLGI